MNINHLAVNGALAGKWLPPGDLQGSALLAVLIRYGVLSGLAGKQEPWGFLVLALYGWGSLIG